MRCQKWVLEGQNPPKISYFSDQTHFLERLPFFEEKKVDIKIKIFEYKENLSIVKLSLKIFAGSLSPLKIIKMIKNRKNLFIGNIFFLK